MCTLPEPADEPGSVAENATFCAQPDLAEPHAVTHQEAAEAWNRARKLASEERYPEALLSLELVALSAPEIADRVAVEQGQWLVAIGNYTAAKASYELAAQSIDGAVAAAGRVGRVRCLIGLSDAGAARALDELVARYRALPEKAELRYELAASFERRGRLREAASLYRTVDLENPWFDVAARARDGLNRLAARGVNAQPLSMRERVDRAERLLRYGPLAPAQAEVEELTKLDPEASDSESRARIASLEATLDRLSGETPRDTTVDLAHARQELAKVLGRRSVKKLPLRKLPEVVRIAAEAGMTDLLNEVFDTLEQRRGASPQLLESALLAVGAVSDDVIAKALEQALSDSPSAKTRYHYARTLERLGRAADATNEYNKVIREDTSSTRYYKMWARARLVAMAPEAESAHVVSAPEVPTPQPGAIQPVEKPNALPVARDYLDRASRTYGGAFPWFTRALALVEMGELRAASDELHEAYVAWRQARGRPIPWTGVEAVYRLSSRPLTRVEQSQKRARTMLDDATRERLGFVARALGDEGTAIEYDGYEDDNTRPRPYAAEVRQAAERHGVDPDLLYAVMRVESVYQRRIVSYAGAVGLMQIMPRTGSLIARQRGNTEFSTAELLDPATNIDFAAWYLRSLIDRFDGRLALAVAAYNGGPHNVRRWLAVHPPAMPLDVFLEHIPFGQTYQYVRRVLTFYESYRANEGLQVAPLDADLPDQPASTMTVAF